MSVQRARPDRSIVDVTVSRHDLLLLSLPVPLLAAAAAGVLTATPLHLSVGAGSLPSALLVAYGLFVDAPAAVPASAPLADARDDEVDVAPRPGTGTGPDPGREADA